MTERKNGMIFVIGGAYQGKTEYVNAHFGEEYQVVNQYHRIIRNQLKQGQSPMEEAKKLLQVRDRLVIISDEVGYGLVPADAFEREYRELCGRVSCYLAGEAEQVIRVVCGVGARIK